MLKYTRNWSIRLYLCSNRNFFTKHKNQRIDVLWNKRLFFPNYRGTSKWMSTTTTPTFICNGWLYPYCIFLHVCLALWCFQAFNQQGCQSEGPALNLISFSCNWNHYFNQYHSTCSENGALCLCLCLPCRYTCGYLDSKRTT